VRPHLLICSLLFPSQKLDKKVVCRQSASVLDSKSYYDLVFSKRSNKDVSLAPHPMTYHSSNSDSAEFMSTPPGWAELNQKTDSFLPKLHPQLHPTPLYTMSDLSVLCRLAQAWYSWLFQSNRVIPSQTLGLIGVYMACTSKVMFLPTGWVLFHACLHTRVSRTQLNTRWCLLYTCINRETRNSSEINLVTADFSAYPV
jgi:hypothetical protein